MIFDINIGETPVKIAITRENMLGEGNYGSVYIKKHMRNYYAVKFSENVNNGNNDTSNNHYFDLERHIYLKYYSNNNNNHVQCIPKYMNHGSIQNKLKTYHYIVTTYAGSWTLSNFMTLINIYGIKNQEIKNVIDILYSIGEIYMNSLHTKNIVCRDIKPDNIVLSDYLYSYISSLYITKQRSKYIPTIANCTYSIIKMFYDTKQYHNIMQFVDMGLCCDLSTISETSCYDPKNEKCFAIFPDLKPFDTLFAASFTYISPFSLFDYSKLLRKDIYTDEKRKILVDGVKVLLKLSDIWSFNVIFAILFYNLTGKSYYKNNIGTSEGLLLLLNNETNETNKSFSIKKSIDYAFFDINKNIIVLKSMFVHQYSCKSNDYINFTLNQIILLANEISKFTNMNIKQTLPINIDPTNEFTDFLTKSVLHYF